MTFMTVGMEKSMPFISKAVSEVNVENEWLGERIFSVTLSVQQYGFQNITIVLLQTSTVRYGIIRILMGMNVNLIPLHFFKKQQAK